MSELEESHLAGVSLGTGQAIENVYMSDREVYPYLFVNLRTLFRNIYTVDMAGGGIEPYLTALIAELTGLMMHIETIRHGAVTVVPYCCTHKTLGMDFPKALLKPPNTDRQKIKWELELRTISALYDDPVWKERISEFNVKLTPPKGIKAYVLTHMPIDLLSRYEFDDLILMESFTGKLKKMGEWNTKLTGGDRLHRVPFNKATIQIFGDGTTFKGYPIIIKKKLMEVAHHGHWHPLTTKEKMLNDLRRFAPEEVMLYDTVTAMFRAAVR